MRNADHHRPRPLVVASDPKLLDDVLRVAAAADVEPEVAADLGAARRSWPTSPLVVVGGEEAGSAAERSPLPRRPWVYVAVAGAVDETALRAGLALGATAVLSLPDDEDRLAAAFADTAESDGRPAPVVAVVGGRGGAGASTLAAAIAITAARRRHRVTLVDADPLGGGIELVLGGEDEAGLRWSGLRPARGRTSGTALRAALPACGGVHFISWDRATGPEVPAEATASVVEAAMRVSDIVVADVCRYPCAPGQALFARSTATFLVVPAEVRSAAAGERVVRSLRQYASGPRAVVRVPGPCGLDPHAVADALGIPLFAELRPERGIGQALEQGIPPARGGRGPLARLSAKILDEVTGQPAPPAADAPLVDETPGSTVPGEVNGDLSAEEGWPDEDEVTARILAYSEGWRP